jgi:hypothetical protein
MKDQLISFDTAKLAKDKGFYIEPEDGHSVSFVTRARERWTMFQTKRHIKKEYDKASSYALITTQSSLQKWLRDEHSIFLESRQTALSDTGWTIVDCCGEILKEEVIWPYYDGFPVEGHMFEESGYENTIQEALKLITGLKKI